MKIIKKGLDFYINSSIHVGVAVFCLVQISYLSDSYFHFTTYSFLVFFGTIVGYNFLKHFENFVCDKKYGVNFIEVKIVSLVSGIGFGVLFFQQNSQCQIDLVWALVFVLVYPLVRKIGWIKLFYVSFVVSYVTVFIPLQMNEKTGLLFLQRFFILSSFMIPFEILDSKTDAVAMQTLPQLFGIVTTKRIGYGLVLLFILVACVVSNSFEIDGIIALISVIFIHFSSSKRNKYYTLFWVESMPILWWFLGAIKL